VATSPASEPILFEALLCLPTAPGVAHEWNGDLGTSPLYFGQLSSKAARSR
jgi:hypothetical protein